jgi:alginate O-acetyltransferase complex protein AlgI
VPHLAEKLRIRFGKTLNVLEPIALAILLIMVTGYLVDGSFNPFLYFRF